MIKLLRGKSIMFYADVQVLEMIQSIGQGWYLFMKSLSKIGESNNYFLIIVFLMWCVHYRKFAVMAVLLPLCGLITAGLKYGLQLPRPYHISEKIDLIEGYGMPSGHAMSAVVFWGYLCHVFNRKWFAILSVLLIIGIGVARVYCNSHYPSQIAAGFLIGIMILWCCIRYMDRIAAVMRMLSRQKAWIISGILPVFFIGLTAVLMIARFDGSGMEDVTGVFSNAGLLFGFSVGLYLMSRKGVLDSKAPLIRQILKLLIMILSFGLVGYANHYAEKAYGLNLIAGSSTVLIVNYLSALWFCYYGPLILTKLNLFRLEKKSV
jgi:membrane-associated phospholipid phosphatase